MRVARLPQTSSYREKEKFPSEHGKSIHDLSVQIFDRLRIRQIVTITRARTYEISSGVSLSPRVHNPTKKRKQSILNIPRQEKAYAC